MKKLAYLVNFLLAVFITVLVSHFFDLSFKWSLLVFLLSHPWKVGKNLYSVFGGMNEDGNIYSIISLFQVAEKNAYAVVSIFAQKANNEAYSTVSPIFYQWGGNRAFSIFGLCIYQLSKGNATFVFGFCVIQGSQNKEAFLGAGICLVQEGRKSATLIIGFVLVQSSDYGSSVIFVGISGFQLSDNDISGTVIGFTVIQKGKYVSTVIGVSLFQISKEETGNLMSFSLLQKSTNEDVASTIGFNVVQISPTASYMGFGITLYQKGEKNAYSMKKAYAIFEAIATK